MNILTTGVSRGLGLALLKQAVAKGHFVYGTVRHEQAKSMVLNALNEQEQALVSIHLLDVCEEAKLKSMSAQLENSGIELDVIINNAAVLLARQTDITTLSYDDLLKSFEVNFFGAMMVVKHFMPRLNAKHSKIINISSEAGSITNAYAGDYPYSLSKCAMNLFSEQLSRTLKEHNKQVWSIHPGWMRTDMGGPNAALEVAESAVAIMNIADGTTPVSSKQSFINFKGEAMAF